MSKTLPKQQSAFVKEYVIDFNGTQAAIRAGYSEKTANEQASRLLTKVSIQQAIENEIKKRSLRTEITQDRVLLEIARLAFNDPRKAFDSNGNIIPIKEWADEVAAAISSIKFENGELKEIKFWDKTKNIELAGKHLGMFLDKKQEQALDKDELLKNIAACLPN